jgi:pilus assembly protein CpaE
VREKIDVADSEGTLLWITNDPARTRPVVEAIAREFKLGLRFSDYEGVSGLSRAGDFDMVGIELGGNPAPALALIRALTELTPRVTVFAASDDTSVATMRAALHAGASDFLALPLNPPDLHKALIRSAQAGGGVATSRGGTGDVITVCGARGGLGVTTIAVNLAVGLAALAGSEAALVDLDLQRGDVPAFLNLTPTQSLTTLATANGELDSVLLATALIRHRSGVLVLPAPLQIEEADAVTHEIVARAVQLLRSQCRYTVVDTARTITGTTLAAFEQSHRILVVTDLSVPGVRAAGRTVELLGRLNVPSQRVELLVTQIVPGPVNLKDAVRAIGKEPLHVIPRDEVAARDAMNEGIPLNGKPGGLPLAIRELASKLADVRDARKPKRAQLWQRLFSKERPT